MDATDLRIVRAVGLRPFETWPRDPGRFRPGHLAMQAGVSPETAKARLVRMREDGVLSGFEVYPNVRYFGFQQTTFHLQVSDDVKRRARSDLEPIDGLVAIYDFLGADICVDMAYRDPADLSRKIRLVSRLTDQPEEAIVPFYDRALPEPAHPLGRLDWRIIQALRGDGRRTPEDVGEAIGVSARTVRRHQAHMEKVGAIDIVAVLDLGKVPDLSVFNLVFHLDDPDDRHSMAAIRRSFDASFLYAWQPPSKRFGSYHATLFARNNAEMESLRRQGAALPGVSTCSVMIPCGMYYEDAWLDEAIAARATA